MNSQPSTMLRGFPPRHDGPQCQQAVQDRDRDRQREQQRKERAQMLPDDKETHSNSQDLFHAPVKVRPSVEDVQTQQIRHTLGNFDTVKHLMLDSSARRLVGVDQGLGIVSSGAPVPPHRHASNSNTHGVDPSSYRPPANNSSGLTTTLLPHSGAEHNNLAKNHYQQRPVFSTNQHSSGTNNKSSSGSQNNSTSAIGNNVPNNINSFRTSSNPIPPNPAQKVSHSQNQLHNNSLYSSTSNSASGTVPNNCPNNNSGPTLSTTTPQISNNNNHVRSKPNLNHGHGIANNTSTSSGLVYPADYILSAASGNKINSVFSNELNPSNSVNVSKDKNSRYSSSIKKPAERPEPIYDLPTILKEMVNCTSPLDPIVTPVKENPPTIETPEQELIKRDDILETISSSMAKPPSPLDPMESSDGSSSSDDSSSDSESDDSSSGSHTEDKVPETPIIIAPPAPISPQPPMPRWNLGSFLQNKNNSKGSMSPKDGKSTSFNSIDSSSDVTVPHPEVVSSTSVSNKPQPETPTESVAVPATNIVNNTKPVGRTRSSAEKKPETNIPPKQVQPSIPTKGRSSSSTKKSSLSATSSEDEAEEKPKKVVVPKPTAAVNEKKPTPTRKRPRQTSASSRHGEKSGRESSPENKKNIQDRNKSDTIRKLFRPYTYNKDKKVESPSVVENDPIKATHGAGNSSGGGKQAAATTNRVPGKDSGRKGNQSSVNGELDSSATYLGAIDISGTKKKEKLQKEKEKPTKEREKPTKEKTLKEKEKIKEKDKGKSPKEKEKGKSPKEKEKEKGKSPKEKEKEKTIQDKEKSLKEKEKEKSHKEKDVSHGKKTTKQSHTANSHGKTLTSPGSATTVSAVSLVKLKEETATKSSSTLALQSQSPTNSLLISIPLALLPRKPLTASTSSLNAIISPASRADKDLVKTGKGATAASSVTSNNDSHRLKVPHHSSRVGSSSDPSNQPFAPHDTSIPRERDDPLLCSDSDRLSKNHTNKKRPRERKKSRSSPRKKVKREPDLHIKAENHLECTEVSSNVCDSISVSTTRTPSMETDIVQAPDSSLNPSHLPSPANKPQTVFYSYFDKIEPKDDLFSRDQDSCLAEAKRLKHMADQEKSSTAQASGYLEAGLFFILTGILMERDTNHLGTTMTSTAPHTMYKDTLSLIQYISIRWRQQQRSDSPTTTESKIIILSLRCQSLLFIKLYKLKVKETRETIHVMNDYFSKVSSKDSSSPQLSTPSPHSPTVSPALSSASSGLPQHTPSPHQNHQVNPSPHQNHHVTPSPHQNHHVTPSPHQSSQQSNPSSQQSIAVNTVTQKLYSNMHKNVHNFYNVVMGHETWEQADIYIARHQLEDYFISIDRHCGPLTLHSTLVDLVRYVRYGLQLINLNNLNSS